MSREYPCIYWEKQICKKFTDEETTSYCVEGPCPYETPSNADLIRAMNDHDLAVFLEHAMYNSSEPDWMTVLSWLQQPAEEESC